MGAVAGPLIAAVVGGLVVYLLGNRRTRYERLYERRAEVIAHLTELLFLMQRSLGSWAKPLQPAGVDRDEQRQAAGKALDDLILYYHSNSVWLDLQTCERVESLIETAYTAAWDYMDNLNERGYPQDKEGRAVSKKLWRELPVLRRDLEADFRAILYPAPWWDYPLRVLERLKPQNRKSAGDGSDAPDSEHKD